jgi:hypothetical protein
MRPYIPYLQKRVHGDPGLLSQFSTPDRVLSQFSTPGTVMCHRVAPDLPLYRPATVASIPPQPRLPSSSPSRTALHRYTATLTTNVLILGLTLTLLYWAAYNISIILKGWVLFATFRDVTDPTLSATLTYACTQTPDYGCLLFIPPLETLKQNPHRHVFPSHMVVILYISGAASSTGGLSVRAAKITM